MAEVEHGGAGSGGSAAPAADPAAQEPGLLEQAKAWMDRNPGLSAGAAGAAAIPMVGIPMLAAGAGYDYVKEKLYGRGTEGVAKGENDVESETLRRGASAMPSWAVGATVDKTVGYTKGGMAPDKSQQSTTVERTELPLPYWAHVSEEYKEAVGGAVAGAQAKHREQSDLYDLARDLEDDRRDYAEQEKHAASRFASDQTNARIRLEQARENLGKFGEAPKATMVAAFEKANGLQKVMGLAGFLMGGVSAAGFSALSHRPEKNQFIESFEREAGKVVDAFMTDRDTAGKMMAAERDGMDAIRQSFADERAAREFVMGSVLNTYKAKLEQIAAQFGIDRTRADYQELLSQIDGRAAERFKVAASRIQDTTQQSQKYVAPQPIKVKVPIAQLAEQQIDPELRRDIAAYQAERANYDPDLENQAGLTSEEQAFVQRGKDLQARLGAVNAAVQQAGAQQMFGPQGKDMESRIGDYGDARDKRGINDLEDVSMAADRIARKMARTDTGWLQQYANLVASGAFQETGGVNAFLAQHVAPDTELYNDLAFMANTYARAQAGSAQTKTEIGRILNAIGSGDAKGVAAFNNNVKRSINTQESQLIAQYGIDAARIYHGRRQYLQDTQTPLPHLELKSPE